MTRCLVPRTDLLVRRADVSDVFALSRRLRRADLREIEMFSGHPPVLELLRPFVAPEPKKILAIESGGSVIGMFGVSPSSTREGVGVPWLLASDALIEKHWRQLVRSAHLWIDVLFEDFNVLENRVFAENTGHIKWLKHIGFSVDAKSEIFGAMRGKFHKFTLTREASCAR